MQGLIWFFWFGVAVVVYTYFGYPIVIGILAKLFGKEPIKGDRLPTVSLLIACYNEESVIGPKIENSLALDYPPELLEIVVVADGCTDRTNEIAASYAHRGVKLFTHDQRNGKAAGLNRGFEKCSGEIVVCSDANAMYKEDSIRMLLRHFEDPKVAMVSGEKRVIGDNSAAEGEGIYWKYEGFLKRMDSLLSSSMGAAGEIFAIRRSLWKKVATDSIIEDFIVSMSLVRDGYRVVFDPEAISMESASPSLEEEFKRKVRIVAGGWQAAGRLLPLLSPRYGFVWFQYISHRLLRWMAVPILLPVILLVNFFLSFTSNFYDNLFLLQLGFYSMGLIGYLLQANNIRWKLFYFPFYFCYLNYSALCGARRFFAGKQSVTWEKVKRAETLV